MRCIACKLCKKTGIIPNGKCLEVIPVEIRCQSKTYNTDNIPIYNGLYNPVQCPLCGVSARKRFNIPTFLKEFGWTTPEANNTYYSIIAKEEAEFLAQQEIQKRLQRGEISSNSQRKKLMQILTERTKNVLLITKYKDAMVPIENDE